MNRSLSSLALLAMHEAGADGYALFQLDSTGEGFIPCHAHGVPLAPPGALHISRGLIRQGKVSVASYPLRLEGTVKGMLAFAFRDAAVSERRIAIVDRMAEVIEDVHALPHRTSLLIGRITSLEAELIDAKIAERVRGLLEDPANPDVVEAVVRHVERVQRGRRVGTLLERFLPELEDRVTERKLVVQAKTLLRRRHGMSEEQAYLHLQLASRTSRRRLRDVSLDLIGRWQEGEGQPPSKLSQKAEIART